MGRKFIGLDFGSTSISALVYDYDKNIIVSDPQVIDMDELASSLGIRTKKGMIQQGENGYFVDGKMVAAGTEGIMGKVAGDNSFANKEVVAGSVSVQGHLNAYLREGAADAALLANPSKSLEEQMGPYFTCFCPTWQNTETTRETEHLNELMATLGLNVNKMAERYPGPQIKSRVGTPAYDDAASIICGNALVPLLMTGVMTFSGPGDAAASGFVNLDTLKLDKRAMKIIAPDLENKVEEVTPPGTLIGRVTPFFKSMGFENLDIYTSDQDNIKSGAYALFRPNMLQISLGTSYTAYVISKNYLPGFEGNFASNDSEFPYILLLCKNNGSNSITDVLAMHNYSKKDFARVSNSLRLSKHGNDGKMALPLFKNEIFPYAPEALGFVRNYEDKGFRADIRAAAEGNAASLIDAARGQFGELVDIGGVSFVGGATPNKELMEIWANMAGVDCYHMYMADHAAAIGSALTAATDYLNNQKAGSATLQGVAQRFIEKNKPKMATPDIEVARMYREDFVPEYIRFQDQHTSRRK